jgi:predicted HTH domain antitoxin
MKTVTLSVRVEEAEARALGRAASSCGTDRSALMKMLLRRGLAELLFERACEAYRRGEVTLSRAAEMAGISYRDMLVRLSAAGLELTYDGEALAADLGVRLSPPKPRR